MMSCTSNGGSSRPCSCRTCARTFSSQSFGGAPALHCRPRTHVPCGKGPTPPPAAAPETPPRVTQPATRGPREVGVTFPGSTLGNQ